MQTREDAVRMAQAHGPGFAISLIAIPTSTLNEAIARESYEAGRTDAAAHRCNAIRRAAATARQVADMLEAVSDFIEISAAMKPEPEAET